MLKQIKLWTLVLLFIMPACMGIKKDAALITSIDLGATNTKLDMEGGIVDEYDLRISVRTKEDAGVEVQSLTVTTPAGASFTAERDDKAAIDQIDPEYGIEVIRGFEKDGNEGVWILAAIANKEYELFGDGFYTITADSKNAKDQVELWYGEPGTDKPLPFPQNKGFTEPDVSKTINSPVTFTWETDPTAQNISVYFASEGKERSDSFSAAKTSFGPYDYAPGFWELELALFVEREGMKDGISFTISKGTVYSTEAVINGMQAEPQEEDDSASVMDKIRRDKFNIFLPQIMQDNQIDMWIQVIRRWSSDPLSYEFGGEAGVFIFTDLGSDRVERAVFNGEVQDPEAYDIVRGEAYDLDYQDYRVPKDPEKPPETELDYRFNYLREFVEERNPKHIGLNYSETLSLAEGSEVRQLTDGISHTDYVQLVKALGKKYAKRIVSAEHLILDYLSIRTEKEIEVHHKVGLKATEYLDAQFAKIVPDKTSLGDLAQNVFVRDHDGNEHNNDSYVIQRGDLVGILHGAGDMLKVIDADTGGTGYVLREGETELPPEVQKLWKDILKIRKILQKNIKAGPNAKETLNTLITKLEDAGYVYIDRDEYDKNADPKKTQVHLDLHAMGKGVLSPRISPMGPKWHWNREIKVNHTFTFEYMVHMPVPEWGKGKHLYACLHDGAIVTEQGVEFPYPPTKGIYVIR